MKIAVMGTGMVGRALTRRLVVLGHDVAMGSRSADNPDARDWAKRNGATHGAYRTPRRCPRPIARQCALLPPLTEGK